MFSECTTNVLNIVVSKIRVINNLKRYQIYRIMISFLFILFLYCILKCTMIDSQYLKQIKPL